MVAPPAGRGDHADPRRLRGRRAPRDRHAREQRQSLDQAVQRLDPGDAAIGEERLRHVVLAGERAGMGDRELARLGRAAELVGQDRLAARAPPRARRRAAHRHGAAFRGTACSRRSPDHRASRRRSRRAKDRPRCRPRPGRQSRCRAPCRARAARRSCCRCGRPRRCGRPGRSCSSKAALAVSITLRAQVDHAEARRPDDAQAGASTHLAQLRDARERRRRRPRRSRRPARSRPSRRAGRIPATASTAASRRRHDIGVLRHLGQRRERRPGALAQHGVAAPVDRIDAARVAGLPQIFQRPAGGLGRVVRIARRWRRSAARAAPGASSAASARASSFGGAGMALALVEAAVEDVLGDAVLQHLDRAAGDHPAAGAPHAVFHQRLAAVADRAHDLHASFATSKPAWLQAALATAVS